MIRLVYEKQPTAVLQAVLAGFERDFDDACSGKSTHSRPPEWFSQRLAAIRSVIEQQQQDKPVTDHKTLKRSKK